jgi:hypothetical protein
METELWYHGTPNPDSILDKGFNINHQRTSDPGDFGWGTYASRSLSRSRCYGTVLGVLVDTSSCAYISNPYFLKGINQVLPSTFEEHLFYDIVFDTSDPALYPTMLTIKGPRVSREAICKEIRDKFLENGYTGIATDYNIGELVIFDHEIIKDVFLLDR